MSSVLTEILVLALLVLANGVFAMSEFAVISARKTRLQQRAGAGDKGARTALELAESSDQFLSAIQVGITIIGILAGAVSGASLANSLAEVLGRWHWIGGSAYSVAMALVVVAITYLTLVLGELVPKRIALNNPEKAASLLAPPMRFFSLLTKPVVRFLSASTEAVLRLLGVRPSAEPSITEDEIRAMLEQGTVEGVIQEVEQDMVERVFRLNDRLVSVLMTPRPDVAWLDLDDPDEELRRKIVESPYSRFPVAEGDLENVQGEVRAKDLLVHVLAGKPFDLRAVLRPPLYVPEIMPALTVLEAFKQSGTPMALVIDEYGSLQGVVTLTDILEAIVGDIPSAEGQEEPMALQRPDGSWLVDGMLPVDEFKEIFGIEALPAEDQGLYQTVAGFVVMQLGQVPSATDSCQWGGLRFEVMDMDGPRVDKVLVTTIPTEEQAPVSDAD